MDKLIEAVEAMPNYLDSPTKTESRDCVVLRKDVTALIRQHASQPAGDGVDAKRLLVLLSPVNTLIGAARSADCLSPDSNLDGWKAGILERAEAARVAVDELSEELLRSPSPSDALRPEQVQTGSIEYKTEPVAEQVEAVARAIREECRAAVYALQGQSLHYEEVTRRIDALSKKAAKAALAAVRCPDAFDHHRVREWAMSNPRKPANTSFTASTNRNVAYLIEELNSPHATAAAGQAVDEEAIIKGMVHAANQREVGREWDTRHHIERAFTVVRPYLRPNNQPIGRDEKMVEVVAKAIMRQFISKWRSDLSSPGGGVNLDHVNGWKAWEDEAKAVLAAIQQGGGPAPALAATPGGGKL